MNKIISIQLKAAFLITVFALNTVVGFACAVGLDMGFNAFHHEEKEIKNTSVHVHANGQKHQHHNEAANSKSKDAKDNCCHEKVVKLAEIDKAVPPSANAFMNPLFITAFFSSYYNVDISYPSEVTKGIKFFVRSHHPPIPDIRIAIQSFQV